MLESGFYNMDCMDGMREFPDGFFSLAVVDVPYGIGEDGSKTQSRRISCEKWKNPKPSKYKNGGWDFASPNIEYFNELFRVSKNTIIWGANHFISKIPFDSSCWIVWKKNGHCLGADFADCELAWTSFKTAVRFFDYPWTGFGAVNAKEERIHPTQKPIALYTWLLQNYAHRGDKILDTHVGSASSLIACHRMGFEYWGYELDADYFKAASERLEREKSTTPLFAPQEIYKQGALEI